MLEAADLPYVPYLEYNHNIPWLQLMSLGQGLNPILVLYQRAKTMEEPTNLQEQHPDLLLWYATEK